MHTSIHPYITTCIPSYKIFKIPITSYNSIKFISHIIIGYVTIGREKLSEKDKEGKAEEIK
jgi:hypothetical protein